MGLIKLFSDDGGLRGALLNNYFDEGVWCGFGCVGCGVAQMLNLFLR
jgi:hypothetical protein